jgi:hypothetical protein
VKVLLLQLDGSFPNLALMRIAAHHRDLGDDVVFRRASKPERVAPHIGDWFDRVYASSIFSIFEESRACVEAVRWQWPGAFVGGTGVGLENKLEDVGIETEGLLDYSIYPRFQHSMGFSQRGCRLNCSFCGVPGKEGKVRETATISEIYRGDPWPKNILLLDNDFFGQPAWRERIREIRDGGFRVSFNQGINARFITDEAAAALADIDVRDDGFTRRRIYTAWDNRKDEKRLFDGLERLVRLGNFKPDQIMVYMLIGYWPGETHADRDYRRQKLREFGARPYPMPFERTEELMGFSRWCQFAYDKDLPKRPAISWEKFMGAKWQPANLRPAPTFPLLEVLS